MFLAEQSQTATENIRTFAVLCAMGMEFLFGAILAYLQYLGPADKNAQIPAMKILTATGVIMIITVIIGLTLWVPS